MQHQSKEFIFAHYLINHFAPFARANPGCCRAQQGSSEACAQRWQLTSVMLIHTFSQACVKDKTQEEEDHCPLISAFCLFLHTLTVGADPFTYSSSLSSLTAHIHLNLSLYLHGPQHSREMGVSLMKLSSQHCCKAGKYYYHLSLLCLCFTDKEGRYLISK